jgi:hypothetical protein
MRQEDNHWRVVYEDYMNNSINGIRVKGMNRKNIYVQQVHSIKIKKFRMQYFVLFLILVMKESLYIICVQLHTECQILFDFLSFLKFGFTALFSGRPFM